MTASPYHRKPTSRWFAVTQALLRDYPLSSSDLVAVVQGAWEGIFESSIGRGNYRIGREILPQPQVMGFLLHELIPLELERTHAGEWRRGTPAGEPDSVCIANLSRSFEIKTSSSSNGIFGNRSYAQEGSARKRSHAGYYLAVNFEKFETATRRPELTLIRFGWLDGGDWIGQKAQTGQQARLTPEARAYKLIPLWSKGK